MSRKKRKKRKKIKANKSLRLIIATPLLAKVPLVPANKKTHTKISEWMKKHKTEGMFGQQTQKNLREKSSLFVRRKNGNCG